MIYTPLPLSGAYRIDLERREDSRGFFARCFCEDEFSRHGLKARWIQINMSYNRSRGTLRGMHFQRPPEADAKVVSCVRGAAHDVIVDLRAGSPTYGKWCAVDIDETNKSMIYVPEGFAHGFQTTRADTELVYFHSTAYAPAYEGGIRYDDPTLSIDWPIPVTNVSERDLAHPLIGDIEPFRL
ncbi:MAG: dTDP-4-dehydrorhamnose 3,5-epimerase [Hyphomicrobiales bacterium]|nr:dTDP-4-dehydrorhamnose 3,5-epimerase [Hyphomicrobiales bacterium]MDE1972195.1 dTDP-4-dehydrorhamnose 3,5-epimerase [Hyphomicrobiales bacterium]MDE2286572.1 dTDP-4-dehydrorhamnose 3,5-epimerase [Hyphomicrobiales bacterium]